MDGNKRPYQLVGATLKTQLESEKYYVGQRLPPEREIAESLNVSRTVVREAIIMLELEGLVEVRMGSGTYVINLPKNTGNIALYDSNDDVGPFEMLQARQLLESNIAEFAALQVTPSDIIKMKMALEQEKQDMINHPENQDGEGDKNFHLCIAEATQNSILVEMLKYLWKRREASQMWQTLHLRINSVDYKNQWVTDHEAILSALQKKDPNRSKYAMWQHLENVKLKLFELSDTEDPNFDGYLFNSNPIIDIDHLNK